jgi:hypothetical protein
MIFLLNKKTKTIHSRTCQILKPDRSHSSRQEPPGAFPVCAVFLAKLPDHHFLFLHRHAVEERDGQKRQQQKRPHRGNQRQVDETGHQRRIHRVPDPPVRSGGDQGVTRAQL